MDSRSEKPLTRYGMSQSQLDKIYRYVEKYNGSNKTGPKSEPKDQKNQVIRMITHKWDELITLHRIISSNYNKLELQAIDLLETLITIFENLLFVIGFAIKGTSIWKSKLNIALLQISKIWMILTIKTSISRYWKLIKLNKAIKIMTSQNNHQQQRNNSKIVLKAKLFTILNLGLCLIEIVELLEIPRLQWIVSIYNVYRMVGNGSLCLEDDEEKLIQDLFEQYDI